MRGDRRCLGALLYVLFVGGALWGLPLVANAASYYVDAARPDDTGNGLTPETAWKSLAKVNGSLFSPGDTILLLRGQIWRESLLLSASGQLGQPVVVGAYGSGALPRITGGDLLIGWAANATTPAVWRISLPPPDPQRVFFDGVAGVRRNQPEELLALGEWCWQNATSSLYVYAPSNPSTRWTTPGVEVPRRQPVIGIGPIHDVVVENLQADMDAGLANVALDGNATNVTLRGLQVFKGNNNGILISSNPGGVAKRLVVESCRVESSLWHGIAVYKHESDPVERCAVRQCTVTGNEGSGILPFSNSWVIESNFIYNNGFMGGEKYAESGIHVYSHLDGSDSYGDFNIVRFNIIFGQKGYYSDSHGIITDHYCDYNQVYGNVCFGNWGAGFMIFDGQHNIYTHNTAFANQRHDCALPYLRSEFGLAGAPDRDRNYFNELRNNIGYATYAHTQAVGVDMTTVNNTVSDGAGGQRFSSTLSRNCFYKSVEGTTGNDNWWQFGSRLGNTLQGWQELVGGTDFFANPQFQNPAEANFNLQRTSPVRRAGTAVSLPGDIQGRPVRTPPDLGAYQFSGGGALPWLALLQ